MNQNQINITEIILKLAYTLFAARHRLRAGMGAKWPSFDNDMQAVLKRMAEGETPILVILNRFIDLAEDYPEVEKEIKDILDRVIDPASLEGIRGEAPEPDTEVSKNILDGTAPLQNYAQDVLPNWHEVVNIGFSSLSQPQTPLSPMTTLSPGNKCFFWLEIGPSVAGSIEETPTGLPQGLLPEGARLQVVLYSPDKQITLPDEASLGLIQLLPKGGNSIYQQPASLPAQVPGELAAHRLFFPLTIPDTPGLFHLICHIYYQQILIQSRKISVEVTLEPQVKLGALRSQLDYNLSNTLQPSHLVQLKPHQLSITHQKLGGFHLFGKDGSTVFSSQAPFDAHAVQNYIDMARKAMRWATWGDGGPWRGQAYRYEGRSDIDRLTLDLARFAQVGYRFYVELVERLDPKPEHRNRLKNLLRQPGLLQMVSHESERMLFPISIVYDATLDANLPLETYQLCPAFKEALQAATPLEETPCFQGNCPNREQDRTICPSGFWGYRHYLGFPISVDSGRQAATAIRYHQTPQMAMCVSTDPALRLRTAHENSLKSLWPENGWHYANSSEGAFAILRQKDMHIVYFYCHGGVKDSVPYLQVGHKSESVVTKDSLFREEIFWTQPRPLIFINGCHTAALEPETAINLVSGFVRTANAAGVIGTEITIFESLARAFSEKCLTLFLHGVPIGEAVRNSRLSLLKAYNPLGLVYIPYVIASLQLVESVREVLPSSHREHSQAIREE